MRPVILALLLTACRPDDSAGQPVPDFSGNLGPTAPDMARDLSPPPIDVAFSLDGGT